MIEHKELALGPVLDIQGTPDITLFEAFSRAASRVESNKHAESRRVTLCGATLGVAGSSITLYVGHGRGGAQWKWLLRNRTYSYHSVVTKGRTQCSFVFRQNVLEGADSTSSTGAVTHSYSRAMK